MWCYCLLQHVVCKTCIFFLHQYTDCIVWLDIFFLYHQFSWIDRLFLSYTFDSRLEDSQYIFWTCVMLLFAATYCVKGVFSFYTNLVTAQYDNTKAPFFSIQFYKSLTNKKSEIFTTFIMKYNDVHFCFNLDCIKLTCIIFIITTFSNKTLLKSKTMQS